jgi:acyl-CoA synthetase (AMP-forming)/AMP-acid ligase II
MSGALARLLDEALRPDGRVADGLGQGTPFDALRDRAGAVAQTLAEHGLRADEPVHLAIGNRATDIAAILGIWRAGGVVVPLHVASAPGTLARARALTGARFAVDGDELTDIGTALPPPRPLLQGAALVIFTSGSTGLPKGVVLGHDALAGKLDVLDVLLRFTPGDTVAVPLQMTFIFGIWASLLTLHARATLVLVPRFSAAALSQVLGGGATVLAAVPSMLRTMVAEGGLDGAGLRMLLTGGEPLGPELRRAVAQAWPQTDVHDLYGLTETGSCDFCRQGAQDATQAGSIGRPTAQVAFRIVGSDGHDLPVGEPGELQIRTPFGMLGYLDNPALTESSFDGGYFRTGDIARRRPDGCVELVGRIKEIVSRGGNKIAPQEIDNLLCSHPDVAAALSAGVPDARLGEALHAVVVLKAGATLTAQGLRQWAAERIERFKVPDVISIENALPLGPTGKASRALIRTGAAVLHV